MFAGLSSHSVISGVKVVVDYMSTLSCNDLVIIVLFKFMISAQPTRVHYRKPLSQRSNLSCQCTQKGHRLKDFLDSMFMIDPTEGGNK